MTDWEERAKQQEAENKARMKKVLLRGAAWGMVVVAVLVVGLSLAPPAPEPNCRAAMAWHLEQAEAAEDPAVASMHAEMAQGYGSAARAGSKCAWWS